MKVLAACEESGKVRRAFSQRGHDAWSCDMLPSRDNSGHHIIGDALTALHSHQWDLVIAFPPCTYLCNSGVRWLFKDGKRPADWNDATDTLWDRPECRNEDRWADMMAGRAFFMEFLDWQDVKLCIENPISHMYANLPRPTQIIQPWQFGHPESKATRLWLRNLPPLEPTRIIPASERSNRIHNVPPGPERAKIRSETFDGIAEAMADQWGA